jgi:hypothetical protein
MCEAVVSGGERCTNRASKQAFCCKSVRAACRDTWLRGENYFTFVPLYPTV